MVLQWTLRLGEEVNIVFPFVWKNLRSEAWMVDQTSKREKKFNVAHAHWRKKPVKAKFAPTPRSSRLSRSTCAIASDPYCKVLA